MKVGNLIGLAAVVAILNIVVWAAVIGGGVWLVVYILRALNVIPA